MRLLLSTSGLPSFESLVLVLVLWRLLLLGLPSFVLLVPLLVLLMSLLLLVKSLPMLIPLLVLVVPLFLLFFVPFCAHSPLVLVLEWLRVLLLFGRVGAGGAGERFLRGGSVDEGLEMVLGGDGVDERLGLGTATTLRGRIEKAARGFPEDAEGE